MPPRTPDDSSRTLDDDGMAKIIEKVDEGGGRSLATDDAGIADDDGQRQADVDDGARTGLRERLADDLSGGAAADEGDLDAGDAVAGDEGTPPPSLRESLAADYGLEGFDRYESDEDAVRALADEYARLSDHLAHLQAQDAPADPQPPAGREAPPEKPEFYKAPQFDENWMEQVEFDPAISAYRHRVGRGTPDIAAKVNTYYRFMEAEQQKFWRQGPHEYIRPFVEHVAREVAEEATTTASSSQQQHNQAESFVRENADWMFGQNDQGKPARDPRTGRLRLSEEGEAFYQLIPALDAEGVPLHLQGSIAKTIIERDRFAQQPAGGGTATTPGGAGTSGDGAADQRDGKNMDILRSAARRSTGRGGTVRRGSNRAPAGKKAPSQNAQLNLRQRLRQDIQEKHGLKGADEPALR